MFTCSFASYSDSWSIVCWLCKFFEFARHFTLYRACFIILARNALTDAHSKQASLAVPRTRKDHFPIAVDEHVLFSSALSRRDRRWWGHQGGKTQIAARTRNTHGELAQYWFCPSWLHALQCTMWWCLGWKWRCGVYPFHSLFLLCTFPWSLWFEIVVVILVMSEYSSIKKV